MSEYEKNIAYRESSQIVSTDEYFKARPQIDNHDRRKVFESGFERGWEASKKHYEAAPTPESITIPLAEYEQMKKDAERIEKLEDGLNEIRNWCKAYPITAQISGSNMRHVLKGIQKIIDEAIDKAMEI